MPRFSIITPSYNQGAYIERTIRSVLGQQVDLEYLVVDGGSVDQTLPILQAYQDRLRFISEPDSGHADAVNKGICFTRADIVGWLNSDDIYYAGALVEVERFFNDHGDVDVVYGDAYHIGPDDAFIERYPSEDWNPDALRDHCFIPQPATFFRRGVFERFGLFDTTVAYTFDYDYWFRLARGGARFAHLPMVLAATRLHPDAATLAHRVACHASINSLTRKHLGRTPDRWLFNYAHAVVEARSPAASGDLSTTLRVTRVALGAALRWNHAVSVDMVRTLARWLIADATRPVRPRRLVHSSRSTR